MATPLRVRAGVAIGAVAVMVAGGSLGFAVFAAPAASSPPDGSSLIAAAQSNLAAAQSDLSAAATIPTPTVTPTAIVSVLSSPLPGPTVTATETVTATATVTASPPESPSPIVSATPTPTVTPTPTPTPSPTVTPPTTRPGPSNTGVPAGTTLSVLNQDLVITLAGSTYSNLDIHGYVIVKAPNVTIRDSIIRGGAGPNGNGIVNDTDNAATGFLLEDSTVVPSFPALGLDCVKGWNYHLLRVNLSGTVDGAKMYGPNATIEASWIHDLHTYAHDPGQGNGPSHNDDVQVLSGSNLRIIGNTLAGGWNTAIQVTQDHGPVTSLLVDGNYADAGNVTFNIANKGLPSLAGIVITNNRFGHAAVTHCQILYTKVTSITVSGNVFDDTGLPVKILNTGSTA